MKRFLIISLVIVSAVVLYSLKSVIPSMYSNLGKDAYLKKDYKDAYQLLKTAHKFNRKDQDTRYYYVKTLINMQPDLEIQKELYKFSQENIPDSADLIADRQISKWKHLIFFNVGENYIEQVPFNNKILRWDTAKFPLKVCIETDSNAKPPKYYTEEIKGAFSQWQSSSGYLIKFKFVENPKEAQILVKITPSSNSKMCSEESCKYVVAYTTPEISGDLLKKMTITFYDLNNISKPFSPREIYNTALHEIGHALGIMGHSYNKGDLMYMENNLDKNYDKFRSNFQLISPVDLDTLSLLYKLIPNITNTNMSEFNKANLFFAPIVMGSDEQMNSRKLLEAKNYIQSAPDLPNGYIDLAAAYSEQKEYNSAIEALNKALELSSSDNDRFVIYYNSAIIYMNVHDYDTALKYANMAKTIQPSVDIDGLIAMINLNKGDKDLAKHIYTESLAKNPDNVIDALNLSTIYLREYNLSQAGKVLNNLVAANPNLRNDSRIKRFGLLMFFFR